MDYLKAFLVGGGICVLGQLLIDYTKLTPARILTGFVVLGVALSALGLYGPLAEFAGAGATVPIIGFGHTLFEGIKRAVAEEGVTGLLTGGLTAASGGVTASLLVGLIIAFLFKSKDQS
ncbi:MAG: SpoVA/SpoVAEb family sporulation membrane protein [Oscillospiraceae bacterium]|nr:SpoVA/SpoVAEb family sporulation membrane protein [Oscillospiraceae bacterium]